MYRLPPEDEWAELDPPTAELQLLDSIVGLLERIAVALERSRPAQPECPKCGYVLLTGERTYKRNFSHEVISKLWEEAAAANAEILSNPPQDPEPWPFPQQDPEGTS